jgi:hypothetical protein
VTQIPDTLEALRVPHDSLKPYARNARRGDIDVIKASLRRFGQYKPILARVGTREILAGNQTWLAMGELGWTDIATTFIDVDDDTAKRIVLIDNRASDLGTYDDEALADLLGSLPDLETTGYRPSDLSELLARLDTGQSTSDTEARRPPAKPSGRRGDVWELGAHRLMCGDCTTDDDVDTLLAGDRVALAFTSPPYLDLREYGGNVELDPAHLASFIGAWAPHTELVAVNLGLIIRDFEVVPHWDVYLAAARDAGLKLLSWNVWNRDDATNMASQRMMFPVWHEWVFVFGLAAAQSNRVLPTKSAGKIAVRGQRSSDGSMLPARRIGPVADRKRLGTVLTTPSHKGPSDGDHPAVFPVAVPAAYLEAVTHARDVVADPFGGSGTTLIAAENLGRACRIMEVDPRYCDVIVDRWQRHTGQTAKRVTNGALEAQS